MKELQEDIKELLQKIIVKAYEINENTNHIVFIDFSGHINWLTVQIHINGLNKDYKSSIRYRTKLNSENVLEQLQETLEKLEELEG